MDLEGSLVDTKLRIYPSQNLINFFKSLPSEDNVPVNIIQFVKERAYKSKQMVKIEDDKIPTHLNSDDIENLNKIIETSKIEEVTDVAEDVSLEETTQQTLKVELSKNDSVKQNSLKPIIDNKMITKSQLEHHKQSMSAEESNENSGDYKRKSNGDTKKSKEECNEKLKKNCSAQKDSKSDEKEDDLYLTTTDIDWLYVYLQKLKSKGQKNVPYLHVLLDGAQVKTPQNEVIKRNPVLEARCVKLRAQQEAREYRKMTKSVDNVRMRFPEDSISFQLKQVNRHLIAIGQFIISIFAGFLFGFKGVDWMIGPLDFGFRLLMGVMCALIISLAEIYFLAKKLNEELNVPETVQLGGPPKFVEKQKYYEERVGHKAIDKEHQD